MGFMRWASDFVSRLSASRQQRLCLRLAREANGVALLGRLQARFQKGSLTRDDLIMVLVEFLQRASFETRLPWNQLFLAMPQEQLPQLHQVYACLGQFAQAANLAQDARDLHSALAYSVKIPGIEADQRSLEIAKAINDPKLIAQLSSKVAEALSSQGQTAEAIPHFERAGRFDRASDCHLKLRNFGAAVELREVIEDAWITTVRRTVEEAM